MIKLTDTLLYDESIAFDEHNQNVRDFINNLFYEHAQLDPPSYLIEQAIANGGIAATEVSIELENCKITFDIYVRPVKIVVTTDTYAIEAIRNYQDASNAWKLAKETIILKTI